MNHNHTKRRFFGLRLPPGEAGTVGMSPPANSWMMALEAELETRTRMLVCQMTFTDFALFANKSTLKLGGRYGQGGYQVRYGGPVCA